MGSGYLSLQPCHTVIPSKREDDSGCVAALHPLLTAGSVARSRQGTFYGMGHALLQSLGILQALWHDEFLFRRDGFYSNHFYIDTKANIEGLVS